MQLPEEEEEKYRAQTRAVPEIEIEKEQTEVSKHTDYESAGVAEPVSAAGFLPKLSQDRKMSMTHRGDEKGNIAMFSNIKPIEEGAEASRLDAMSVPPEKAS